MGPSYVCTRPSHTYLFAQAADLVSVTERSVSRDNARAAPVLIRGATGWFSECINGFYEPTQERGLDGRVMYSKCGEAGICIAHNAGCWSVKNVSGKFGKWSGCALISGGCSLDCVSRVWSVPDKCVWTNQTLGIETGFEVQQKVRCR